MKYLNHFFQFGLLALLVSCTAQSSPSAESASAAGLSTPNDKAFHQYWYAGEAEISRFELEQARYGEIHKGDAVMVFVTEDFRTDKQVKLESYDNKDKAAPILKLNFLKKFNTGIYDYSMMTSVFSPTDLSVYPHALKVTTSSQEWCGHTYLQLNQRGENYQVMGHSYFENEADENSEFGVTWLEDEIWNMIRLDPSALPTGEISILRGTMALRLVHQDMTPQSATASIKAYEGDEFPGDELMTYTLDYPNAKANLTIYFDKNFPHQIAGWKESYKSGFGASAKDLTTKAVRTHSMNGPYWGQNNLSDLPLRKKLGLN